MSLVPLHKRERDGEKPKPTRYFSKKQEDQVAKAIGGVRNKNSGAVMFDKGDCKNDLFLIECKTKTSHCDSMSIKKDWIIKNREEAAFMGKPYEAIAFSFGPGEENLYIIKEELFQELVEYLNRKEN